MKTVKTAQRSDSGYYEASNIARAAKLVQHIVSSYSPEVQSGSLGGSEGERAKKRLFIDDITVQRAQAAITEMERNLYALKDLVDNNLSTKGPIGSV
jgi:hypothetical protein